MAKRICLMLGILSVILFLNPAMAADAIKIGMVDINTAALNSDVGRKALEGLRKRFAKQDEDLKRRAEELRKLEDELRNPAMLTPEQRHQKDKDYQRKWRDYRDAFTDFQEGVTKAQREAVMPIQQDIVNLVRKIADEEGFTLIYDPQIMGPAIYVPNAIDLTDRIIETYNKQK